MRIGRLAISRGFPSAELSDEPMPLALVAQVEPATLPPPAADPLAAVYARLDALERLTRLCEAGALTIDEFLAEKAAILGHPPSNLMTPRAEGGPVSFTPAGARKPARGKSLLGRLGWTILPLGLIGGLGLTALSQPEATTQIWQEGLRLLGL